MTTTHALRHDFKRKPCFVLAAAAVPADAADWREVNAPPSRARATNEIMTGMMSCTARMLADMLARDQDTMAVR
jgi:hypothetical protein